MYGRAKVLVYDCVTSTMKFIRESDLSVISVIKWVLIFRHLMVKVASYGQA